MNSKSPQAANTTIEVSISVFPTIGVEISFDPCLQVSLDCLECDRVHRTVIFAVPNEPGRCTPSGHAFPGYIDILRVHTKGTPSKREVQCIFRLNYAYAPVVDRKYPYRMSSRLPVWGRVYFKTKCPRCGKESRRSIQTNSVRPWTCICTCGFNLYTEEATFPMFKILQPMLPDAPKKYCS